MEEPPLQPLQHSLEYEAPAPRRQGLRVEQVALLTMMTIYLSALGLFTLWVQTEGTAIMMSASHFLLLAAVVWAAARRIGVIGLILLLIVGLIPFINVLSAAFVLWWDWDEPGPLNKVPSGSKRSSVVAKRFRYGERW